MYTDNRFFTLPLPFDVKKLAADLAICEAHEWTAHFNQQDYHGNWNGIALRSATGEQQNILATSEVQYVNTPLLSQCLYFQEIVSMLECPVESVRLLALAPGSEIKQHRDMGLGYQHGCFRLHIPILTDDGVDFIVDNEKLQMNPGELWYANFDLPHSVRHHGSTRRIHLVIDGQRNTWTDELFGKAGYDFEKEKQGPAHDPATIRQMIQHLQLMDTDTARNMIVQLEKELLEKKTVVPNRPSVEAPILSEWLPTEILSNQSPPLCKWMYFNQQLFTHPFYFDTLCAIKKSAVNRHPFAALTSLDFLTMAAGQFESVPPAAFVFHVSRCGSTLLTQLLSTDTASFIAVSEPPVLDEILRLPLRQPDLAPGITDNAFKAAVEALGKKRQGTEQKLLIKTDSWHLFFYTTIRRLYPDTPFILMYRLPQEVFHSQMKQPGIQAVTGNLEQEFLGFDPFLFPNWQEYTAALLEKYYTLMADIAENDTNTILLNYHQGIPGCIAALTKVMGMDFSEDMLRNMHHRSTFHSKRTNETFAEEAAPVYNKEMLDRAMEGYWRLERKRER